MINYKIQKSTLAMKMYTNANGKLSMSESKNLSQLKHNKNQNYRILKLFHEVMFLENKPCKLLDVHNKNQILVLVILFYVLILRIASLNLGDPTNKHKTIKFWT